MKNFRAAVIGLSLFVVFAIGVTTLVYGTLRRDTTGSTKGYSAIFTDVTGVRVGDDVRIAGVRVGRVDSIELDGSLAKLKFRVKSNQNLYGNSIVSVTYQNIIGQRYISLSRGLDGSPERLPEGSVIPVERTEPSFDVGALLNGFEPLFTLLDPKQVDNLSNGLIDAFAGDRGALAHVVAQTTEITKSFAGRDQSLGGLIENLNTVLENVAKQNDNLDQLVVQSQNVVGELDNRRQSLVSSIGSATHVVSRIQTIGDNVYPQLQELVY
ncbi:MAG: MCE family protein, partial [[Mycobacterium] stephanolepidis]